VLCVPALSSDLMTKGTFDVEVSFAAGGNSGTFIVNGWSLPEPEFAWNRGHDAHLVLPKPFEADEYELILDVWPFIVPDCLPAQSIEVLVRGVPVLVAAINSRDRHMIRCRPLPSSVAGCTCVDVSFHFRDAVAPAKILADSPDTRELAVAFFALRFIGHVTSDDDTNWIMTP
jgi:hypothetical protein